MEDGCLCRTPTGIEAPTMDEQCGKIRITTFGTTTADYLFALRYDIDYVVNQIFPRRRADVDILPVFLVFWNQIDRVDAEISTPKKAT